MAVQIQTQTEAISAFEARTHLGEILDKIRYQKRPLYIERHGRPVAVLVDVESYEKSLLPRQYLQWIREATDIIVQNYKPEKIVLFGSAASGEVRRGSDIDLLIVMKSSERQLDRIENLLELIPNSIPVEPHIYTPRELEKRLALNDPFIRTALKGRVLYEAPAK